MEHGQILDLTIRTETGIMVVVTADFIFMVLFSIQWEVYVFPDLIPDFQTLSIYFIIHMYTLRYQLLDYLETFV